MIGTTLILTQPWLVLPDETSIYQIGGFHWLFLSKLWRFHDDDKEQPRRVEILFEPCKSPSILDLRLYLDRSKEPVVWGATQDLNGLSSTAGDEVLQGDLTKANGYLQRRMDGFKDLYAEGPRHLGIELSGVVNLDPIRIYEFTVDGVK